MKLRLKRPKIIEKRSSVRLDVEFPVTFRPIYKHFWPPKRRGDSHQALATKPSLFGMRLCADHLLSEGQKIEIEAQLAKVGLGESCKVHGEVLWAKFNPKTGEYDAGIGLYDERGGMGKWKKAIMNKLRTTERSVKDSFFDPV
jgi:hypothetical protein